MIYWTVIVMVVVGMKIFLSTLTLRTGQSPQSWCKFDEISRNDPREINCCQTEFVPFHFPFISIQLCSEREQ